MSISLTLQKYLADHGIAYDIVSHRHTGNTMNAVQAAHVPADEVAKPVILEDEFGYLMAVVPANHRVKIGRVNKIVGRHMGLATEPELEALFTDCELGAIPPIGEAYGIDTIIDDNLTECPDVYLEAGGHEDFIHLKGASFRKLMKHAQHAHIS
ncbi:MAG: YbaK/EbsC family protein [Granulosicoccaceae bacterium]|jgi:Ala-tRNA(Pro) deacylase